MGRRDSWHHYPDLGPLMTLVDAVLGAALRGPLSNWTKMAVMASTNTRRHGLVEGGCGVPRRSRVAPDSRTGIYTPMEVGWGLLRGDQDRFRVHLLPLTRLSGGLRRRFGVVTQGDPEPVAHLVLHQVPSW